MSDEKPQPRKEKGKGKPAEKAIDRTSFLLLPSKLDGVAEKMKKSHDNLQADENKMAKIPGNTSGASLLDTVEPSPGGSGMGITPARISGVYVPGRESEGSESGSDMEEDEEAVDEEREYIYEKLTVQGLTLNKKTFRYAGPFNADSIGEMEKANSFSKDIGVKLIQNACIKQSTTLVDGPRVWFVFEPGWDPSSTMSSTSGPVPSKKRKREEGEEKDEGDIDENNKMEDSGKAPKESHNQTILIPPEIYTEGVAFEGATLAMSTFWDSRVELEEALENSPAQHGFLNASRELQVLAAAILAGKTYIILPLMTEEHTKGVQKLFKK